MNLWPKLMISLSTLAAFWLAISLNNFLESDAEEKQQVVAEHWTTLEIILRRQCRAAWPLLGDEYDACVGKIKQMYREDI